MCSISKDADWSKAGVWRDADGDGEADAGEFHTLASLGIASVDLSSDGVGEDVAGNRVLGRSTYTLTDGTTRALADVALRSDALGWRRTSDGVEIGIGDDALAFFGTDAKAHDIDAASSGYALVAGGSGADRLRTTGAAGVALLGGAGADILEGGSGSDWLHGGSGADTLWGGANGPAASAVGRDGRHARCRRLPHAASSRARWSGAGGYRPLARRSSACRQARPAIDGKRRSAGRLPHRRGGLPDAIPVPGVDRDKVVPWRWNRR